MVFQPLIDITTQRILHRGWLVAVLLGILAAFVLDESLYLQLIEPSDAAYNGVVSWTGATLGLTFYLLVLWSHYGATLRPRR